ncbi:MAG: DUF1800 family protein [Pseudoxanthomonas sp.]
MKRLTLMRHGLLVCALGTLVACGGGGGGSETPAAAPPPAAGGGTTPTPTPTPTTSYSDIPQSDAEAARFLTQATFGPTRAEIARVRQIGYSKWIDEQMDSGVTPITSVLAELKQVEAAGVSRDAMQPKFRRNIWLWRAATSNDQLRMRVGFALGEIFVVSDREVADGKQTLYRIADYQDMLNRDAFGSYRTALEHVSVHPAMGYFLSHVGNRKADPAKNLTPDENYGREVMQLFSIGLVQRNADFSEVKDSAGNPVPTYDQDVVSGMSRVFTGWTYAGQTDAQYGRNNNTSFDPMECHPKFHDDQPKTIFNGIVINEGNNCTASLGKTLDALAAHKNVAPFISRQLIQRLVTSNPSPAYIGRVSKVWTDNNGHLGKVVKAILLDNEARMAPTDDSFGKGREPLIKIATLWRSFEAKYIPGQYGLVEFTFSNAGDLTNSLQQESMRAPSVFNFFEPGYRLPGANGALGLYAPEFQILTEATYISSLNQNESLVWSYAGEPPTTTTGAPVLDLSRLTAMATSNDRAGMVEEVNLLLFYGAMPAETKAVMTKMLTDLATAKVGANEQARSLVLLAFASPEFAVQR